MKKKRNDSFNHNEMLPIRSRGKRDRTSRFVIQCRVAFFPEKIALFHAPVMNVCLIVVIMIAIDVHQFPQLTN